MEVEARGTHVRLMNKWRNLLSHCSAVWTHPLEFKLVPGLGVGTLYRSTDLTSDTTPYFHNFIHMHGDTDSLFFPSPFELPTTHILCISSHAPTLSSPLQFSVTSSIDSSTTHTLKISNSLSLSLCIDLCLWWSSSLELLMTDHHHHHHHIPLLLPPPTTSLNKLWEVYSFLYLFLYTFIFFFFLFLFYISISKK